MKKMFLPIALGLLSTCGMSCEISAMAVNRDITLAQGRDNLRLGYHLSAALIEDGMPAGATVAEAAQMVSDLRSVQANLRAAGYNADGTGLTKKTDVDQMQSDLATVTGERDTARTDLATAQTNLATVTGERDTARADLATAQTNLTTVIGERDTARTDLATARTDLATVTGERDTARADLATAQTNLTTVTGERDTARADLATAQTNLTTVTGERDNARADLQAVQTNLTTAGYNADGTGLTKKDDVEAAVAFLELFEDAGNRYGHLNDINLRLWRAARASGLKVDMGVLRDSGNALAKLDTVDTADKMKDLPKDQGVAVADLQSATHDHDMVKFALLRGFFNSATYANHDQAALDAVNDVHCDDGAGGTTDVSLGAGGLDLKVE